MKRLFTTQPCRLAGEVLAGLPRAPSEQRSGCGRATSPPASSKPWSPPVRKLALSQASYPSDYAPNAGGGGDTAVRPQPICAVALRGAPAPTPAEPEVRRRAIQARAL